MRKNYLFRDVNKIFLGVLLTYILLTVLSVTVFYILSTYFGVVVEGLYSNLWVNAFLAILLEVGFLALFFVFNKTKNIEYFSANRLKFKFEHKIFWPLIFLAFILVLSSVNFTGMINYMLAGGVPLEPSVPIGNVWQLLFSVVFVALLPAVCEELIFRGMIYNALRRRFGLVLSVILSAAMFALIHFSLYQIVHQFILGVMLALIVYTTGSLVYAMFFHFFNNLIVLLFSYFSAVGKALTFDGFGTVEVLASIAIFVVGVGLITLFFVLLSNYTSRHKKFFNLEKSPRRILSDDKKENALVAQTEKKETLYFVLALLFGVLMWVFVIV